VATAELAAVGIPRAAARIRPLPLLALLLQLGMFLCLLYAYDLESRAFLHLGIVVFFAFAVHYFLPLAWRRPFFAAVSLFCLATVFGFQLERWSAAGLNQAAWIAGIGLALIGICHLPTSIAVRAGLLLAAAAGLTVLRAGWAPVPWSAAIWPVLGSMFMFRTALYLHAMKFEKLRPTLVDALCYFFMLPNPCFPLFPVVDFQTLRRTYYDAPDRHAIYQTGVTWLFRGATHLILYRLVYQNFVVGPGDVRTLPQLVQFLVWPFLLYLRISGQFHIIVGMLHLFGFNLPETHRLYYLSSSFTDFWRRINIYWKDFMMKLFFYPTYVRVKQRGPMFALVFATAVVFFATWVLHAYQWFWIRGTWLFTWNDLLFWTVLAALVIVTLGAAARPTWGEAATTGVKTVAVFATISLLWSFWSSESISAWTVAFRGLDAPTTRQVVTALLMLLGVALAIGVPAAVLVRRPPSTAVNLPRSAFAVVAGSAVLIALTRPEVLDRLPKKARDTVAALKTSELNQRDFARLERGYYENLLDVSQFSPELQEIYRTRPDDWVVGMGDDSFRPIDRPPYFELKPNYTRKVMGAVLHSNAHGLRDRDYPRERSPGVGRFALIGASFVMGVGVEDDQTFDHRLEALLNSDRPADKPRYELLNFGVLGYMQIQQIGVVQNKAMEFAPDAVLYFEHSDAVRLTMMGVVNVVFNGRYSDYEFLADIAAKAGAEPGMDQVLIGKKLEPFGREILTGIYREMVDACRARGVEPVWIYLPRPEDFDLGPAEHELQAARDAGFKIIVLDHVYQGDDFSELWLARWDHHPNAAGHDMIARRLHAALKEAKLVEPATPPKF
jgi:hypothetical protein